MEARTRRSFFGRDTGSRLDYANEMGPAPRRCPKNAPHHTPLPGPAVPATPAPDSEGPLHGSSAGRERTTKCGAHGDDQGRRRTGRAGTGVLEGGALVRGASPSTTCLLTTTTTLLFPSSAPPPPPPFSASSSTKYHAHYWTDYCRPSGGTSSSQVGSDLRLHLVRLSVVHSNSVVAWLAQKMKIERRDNRDSRHPPSSPPSPLSLSPSPESLSWSHWEASKWVLDQKRTSTQPALPLPEPLACIALAMRHGDGNGAR